LGRSPVFISCLQNRSSERFRNDHRYSISDLANHLHRALARKCSREFKIRTSPTSPVSDSKTLEKPMSKDQKVDITYHVSGNVCPLAISRIDIGRSCCQPISIADECFSSSPLRSEEFDPASQKDDNLSLVFCSSGRDITAHSNLKTFGLCDSSTRVNITHYLSGSYPWPLPIPMRPDASVNSSRQYSCSCYLTHEGHLQL
jgi:hypothetical protein